MRLLLDTCALLTWLADDTTLGPRAREAIANDDNPVLISAVLAMDVATKFRLGKLPSAAFLADDFAAVIAEQGLDELAISIHHAWLTGQLHISHNDPFDWLLIAQALAE